VTHVAPDCRDPTVPPPTHAAVAKRVPATGSRETLLQEFTMPRDCQGRFLKKAAAGVRDATDGGGAGAGREDGVPSA
jgi:hypothetical protein